MGELGYCGTLGYHHKVHMAALLKLDQRLAEAMEHQVFDDFWWQTPDPSLSGSIALVVA